MNRKRSIVILSLSLFILLIIGGFATNYALKSQEVQKQVDLGNKYVEDGNYEQAVLAYNEAIKIDPKNVPARVGLAEAYIETGKFDDAGVTIKEIEVLGYSQMTAADTSRIAKAYLKYGHLEDAVKILQAVHKASPNEAVKAQIDGLRENASIGIAVSNESLASGDNTLVSLRCQDQEGQFHTVKAQWKQEPELGDLIENADGSMAFTAVKDGETTLSADIEGVSWTVTLRISALKVTGLTATARSFQEISLSWDANPKATGYKVFRSESQTGQYQELAAVNESNYSDTGLKPETVYWYKVQGIAAAGPGAMTAEVSAKTEKVDEKMAVLLEAQNYYQQQYGHKPVIDDDIRNRYSGQYREYFCFYKPEEAAVIIAYEGDAVGEARELYYLRSGPGQWQLVDDFELNDETEQRFWNEWLEYRGLQH